ncbi:MAG: 4-diphosphocytidyl-2-C-methyl-D-erythritol kinase [Acidimicrobiaceae bacterium]|nr:4-diphosphocytidyl-2-C-methyl-D-erythritol kinase [Acidimicrobiaceae bacterium]MDQ1368734.1 4-diphosphocytidyl-2-C-methyl-D-erythritol kinase [Acidimicrobiaceae bacterium]MDQ1441514.1 4-diphosphocytidyl-2-C-methyl-D-erythritol kinase [Acidimicrobiaceae bacterium]
MIDRQRALAKLTITLRITGVRSDGLHLLDSEMVTIDLADELEFAEGDGLELVSASGSGAGPGAAGAGVPVGDSNLIRRALKAVGRSASVRLRKNIPVGGGLGGGSADAAAVLRWAGVGDLAVAASLGADVPFCLVGGRARVGGIGEVVEPLAFESRSFTLLTPPLFVSTPAVYRAWDELGGPVGDGPNDLEAAALVVEPALAVWRDRLGEATGQTPVLAGSGSTWFVEGSFVGPGLLRCRTEQP